MNVLIEQNETIIGTHIADGLCFDYDLIEDEETQAIVREHTYVIKERLASTATSVVEIGKRLLDVKEHLGHGRFGEWLDAEFAMSQDSAENFMKAARFTRNIPNWSEIAPSFEPSALYQLAARSIPSAMQEEMIGRALVGEVITKKKIQEAKERHMPLRIHKLPWTNLDRSAFLLLESAVVLVSALTELLEQERQLFQERYSSNEQSFTVAVDEMNAAGQAQKLLETPVFARYIRELASSTSIRQDDSKAEPQLK